MSGPGPGSRGRAFEGQSRELAPSGGRCGGSHGLMQPRDCVGPARGVPGAGAGCSAERGRDYRAERYLSTLKFNVSRKLNIFITVSCVFVHVVGIK